MTAQQAIKANSPLDAAYAFANSMISKGYNFEAFYEYKDYSGNTIYWRIRLKHPNGQKWIRPMRCDANGEYILSEPEFGKSGKPLYGSQSLSQFPNADVWIVEGERCTDYLNNFFKIHNSFGKHIALTSGGATSVPQVDWSLVKKRSIIIFPDNDAEGGKYAAAIAEILISQECKIDLIDVQKLGLPPKGDIVDWLEMNPSGCLKDLLALPKTPYQSILNLTHPLKQIETEEQTIKCLSILSAIEYDRCRETEAEKLGIRVSILDKVVKACQQNTSADATDTIFRGPEPWPEPVELHELLNDLESKIRRYCILLEHAYTIVPLWICFTWCIDAADTAPLLAICSPEKRCGKTTFLSILNLLVKRSLPSSNITPAALFRAIEKFSPTLLIDEADTFLARSDDLRGILNSGHKRSTAYVIRTTGDDHDPKPFNTFGAKAIATIGNLPDTLADRSIVIHMRRKLTHEAVQKLHRNSFDDFEVLRRKLQRFSMDNIEILKTIEAQELQIDSDRMADNFEPLLAIASLAGSDWREKAVNALLILAQQDISEPSVGILLLEEMRTLFNDKGHRIFSRDLVSYLIKDEEKIWATYNGGNPINPKQIAKIFHEFGIKSKTLRAYSDNAKGYEYEQFEEVFKRYLKSIQDGSVTPSQASSSADLSVTDSSGVTSHEVSAVTTDMASSFDCDVVTDENYELTEEDYLREERLGIIEFGG